MKRSVNRKHDRKRFYKYMSSETAQMVLKNRSLRWSSPVEFNDPFDIPREILFGIDASEIKKAALQCYIDIVKNPPEDTNDFNPKMKLIFEAIKKADSDELKAEIVNEIQKSSNEDSEDSSSLDEIKAIWRKFILEFRVLCLCESHETVSMWYHYADKYKGVVLELDCNDELDSAWLVAEPISYVDSIPEISTAMGWAKILLKPKDKAVETLLIVCAYSKTRDWSYEREWRVASFKGPHETGTISDYKFNDKEIKSVYLGPLIEQNSRAEILKIVKDSLPHVVVYNSRIRLNRGFIFSKVK